MNIEEAIEILDNGDWWNWLDEYIPKEIRNKLVDALDTADAALRAKLREVTTMMTETDKAIQEFEDEAYHHSLHPEISEKAKTTALAALYRVKELEADKDKPLTLDELREMVGEPVYVTILGVEETPLQYYPAVVFGWRFENPFVDSADFNNNKRIREITVIQPSAFVKNTQFWTEKTYGKYWLAYRHKPKEKTK